MGNIVVTGFTKMDNSVWHSIVSDTNDILTLGVYLALLSHRNTKTNMCFPSKNTLASETGLFIDTVEKKLNILKANGYITWIRGTSGKANQYYFPKEKFYINFRDDDMQKQAELDAKPNNYITPQTNESVNTVYVVQRTPIENPNKYREKFNIDIASL